MPRIRGKDPRPQKKSGGTQREMKDDIDAKSRKREPAGKARAYQANTKYADRPPRKRRKEVETEVKRVERKAANKTRRA
jgi:hypothetical protein